MYVLHVSIIQHVTPHNCNDLPQFEQVYMRAQLGIQTVREMLDVCSFSKHIKHECIGRDSISSSYIERCAMKSVELVKWLSMEVSLGRMRIQDRKNVDA
jgi:hypothetical protein